jgi:predicted transcriptional regulator
MIDIADIAARLQKQKGRWRQLAKQSGVPYFTLTKIARGTITNPGIDTVNKILPFIGDDSPDNPDDALPAEVRQARTAA